MQKTTRLPFEIQKQDEGTADFVAAFHARDLNAANSTPRTAPAETADDLEDMWDNLPI